MKMMMTKNPPTVIDFARINEPVKEDIKDLEKEIMQTESDMKEERREINSLLQRMIKLARDMGIPIEEIPALKEDSKLLNVRIDDLLLMDTEINNGKYSKFPKLNTQENEIFC
ncbi:MAG: hypothetical protein PHV32_01805 [Eubacteriales bacterium]|nr:hypothetical protein [Eubacteriales bacterium]